MTRADTLAMLFGIIIGVALTLIITIIARLL